MVFFSGTVVSGGIVGSVFGAVVTGTVCSVTIGCVSAGTGMDCFSFRDRIKPAPITTVRVTMAVKRPNKKRRKVTFLSFSVIVTL